MHMNTKRITRVLFSACKNGGKRNKKQFKEKIDRIRISLSVRGTKSRLINHKTITRPLHHRCCEALINGKI